MIAITGIAYGSSRKIVTSHGVLRRLEHLELLGQEVEPGDEQRDEEQPEGRAMALDEAGLAAPVGALARLGGAVGAVISARLPAGRSRGSTRRRRPAPASAPEGAKTFDEEPGAGLRRRHDPAVHLGPLEHARVVDLRGRDPVADLAIDGLAARVAAVGEPRVAVPGREQLGRVERSAGRRRPRTAALLEDLDVLVARDDGPAVRRAGSSSPRPPRCDRPRRWARGPWVPRSRRARRAEARTSARG